MKTPLIVRTRTPRQSGFVSIIAVLMLSLTVMVILSQSVLMSGTRALDAQQYYDSVAALAAAESGTELAKAQLVANHDANPDTYCSLTTPAANAVGRGTFTYVSAQLANAGAYCKFRVKGTVNHANRTLENWMALSNQPGVADYGHQPAWRLSNPFNVPALAIVDLAWRVAGSDGHTPSNGNVLCADCTTPLWWDELKGQANALGGVGDAKTAAANGSVSFSHTLGTSTTDSRNYAMVGLLMGGATVAPSAVGSLQFSNTSNSPNDLTQSVRASAGSGCTDDNANAVVLGISGRGLGTDDSTTPNLSAGFDSADLNNVITTSMWRKYAHYPNADGSSPHAMGDVFAEIFYYYKGPPVFATGATGEKNSTTIALPSTPLNLNVGDTLKSGSAIPYGTTITAINQKNLTLSNRLSDKISNGTLCSGICSMVPQNYGSATLTLSRSSATLAKGWVAGIACIKGVDNALVRSIATPASRHIQWHEVLSTDP